MSEIDSHVPDRKVRRFEERSRSGLPGLVELDGGEIIAVDRSPLQESEAERCFVVLCIETSEDPFADVEGVRHGPSMLVPTPRGKPRTERLARQALMRDLDRDIWTYLAQGQRSPPRVVYLRGFEGEGSLA
jgi:hypothetical protein